MLHSNSIQNDNLSHSSSLPSSQNKPIKAPRKVSECQTTISSSFSSTNSFFHYNEIPSTIHTLPELSLLQIFSTQSLLPISYNEYSSKFHFYYTSRLKILQWIEEVLNSISLSIENRNSIYYRFSYMYMLITGKLKEKEIYYTKLNFKILIVAMFLICYKLEGYIVNRVMITTIINSFLSSVNVEEKEIKKMIKEKEVEICLLIKYDIFEIENNLYQLTQMLFYVLWEKLFPNEDDLKEAVAFTLEETNYEIETSNDCKILFDLYPIDRGVISLITSIMIYEPERRDSCIEYFLSELNILHITKQEVIEYCDLYVRKISKDEENSN